MLDMHTLANKKTAELQSCPAEKSSIRLSASFLAESESTFNKQRREALLPINDETIV